MILLEFPFSKYNFGLFENNNEFWQYNTHNKFYMCYKCYDRIISVIKKTDLNSKTVGNLWNLLMRLMYILLFSITNSCFNKLNHISKELEMSFENTTK